MSMEGSYCCSSSHPQCNSHSANSLILAMDALAEEPFVTMRVNFSRGDNPTPDSFLMLLKFLPHYIAKILPFVLQIPQVSPEVSPKIVCRLPFQILCSLFGGPCLSPPNKLKRVAELLHKHCSPV